MFRETFSLSFRNSKSITVKLPESSYDKWMHFAISTSTIFSFYYNRETSDTQRMVIPIAVPANTNIELTVYGEIGLSYISF